MYRFHLFLMVCLSVAAADGQVPNTSWSRILDGKDKSVMRYEVHLTPLEAHTIERFVRDEYAANPDFYEAAAFGDCTTRSCLEVYRVRAGSADYFLVSPTRQDKNPAWWLLKVKGTKATNLAPPLGKDRCWFGYVSIERGVHHGRLDLSTSETSGAARRDLTYFEFDGSRYQAVDQQTFVACDDLQSASADDPKWCFEVTGKPLDPHQ